MDKDEFKLEDDDTAIVIGKDMGIKMFLPKFSEDAVVAMDDHYNVYFTMALMMAMKDEEFNNFIKNKMDTMFTAMTEMEKADGCDHSGGCPGCSGCEEE